MTISGTYELIRQAQTGLVSPVGNPEAADELIGFSFGTYFDERGQFSAPGPINEAIAKHILSDEILRSKNMTLQEDLAVAVSAQEPRISDRVQALPTVKKPRQAYSTRELLVTATPGLVERNVGSLAVVSFRHHMPRATAQVKKAGFVVATPDMNGVGDFDPANAQPFIRTKEAWAKRERKVIVLSVLLGWI